MPSAPPRPTIPRLAELDLVIHTARLELRPFRDGDVDALWPYVSDPEFPKQMSWEAHKDKSETLAFVQAQQQAIAENIGVAWAMVYEGRVVGSISFDSIRWHLRALRIDRTEVGYWLGPPYWGKGLMTEAAHAVVRYGFETIGVHKINVGCLANNPGSRRVIEKVGFRYIGKLEDDVWRDGKWHAHLRYELTAPEWPDVHTTMRVQRPGTVPGR
jgi:[ribosomal protein S5]-alanine N-acetyltransferase